MSTCEKEEDCRGFNYVDMRKGGRMSKREDCRGGGGIYDMVRETSVWLGRGVRSEEGEDRGVSVMVRETSGRRVCNMVRERSEEKGLYDIVRERSE